MVTVTLAHLDEPSQIRTRMNFEVGFDVPQIQDFGE